jgi:hypothetical protein
MKKVFILTLLTFLALGFTACWEFDFETGNGNIETYNVAITEGYDKVEIRGSGKIYIEKGEPKDAVVQIDENLYTNLEMYVRNNTLIIDLNNSMPTKCEINLSMPSIEGIKISGSADVFVEGLFETQGEFETEISGSGDIYVKEINADKIDLNISGSGDIKIYGNTNDIFVDISGSGDVQYIGKALYANVQISGSGDINMANAELTDADVDISGSGNVKIYVLKALDVDISGSGDVYLYNNPETFNYKISGSGKVIHVK